MLEINPSIFESLDFIENPNGTMYSGYSIQSFIKNMSSATKGMSGGNGIDIPELGLERFDGLSVPMILFSQMERIEPIDTTVTTKHKKSAEKIEVISEDEFSRLFNFVTKIKKNKNKTVNNRPPSTSQTKRSK
jgi:hypothetical protein